MNTLHKHGIAVMRIQPLHLGHIEMIERMIKECYYVTILIGSAQYSRTEDNPFTYAERKRMLQSYFPAMDQNRLRIIPIRDIHQPNLWAKNVLGTVVLESSSYPCPDIYYCGDKGDGDLFATAGMAVKVNNRNKKISGSKIRTLLKQKDSKWKAMTTLSTQEIINSYLEEIK